MNDFEKQVIELFPVLRKKTGAFLHFLYPPTKVTGMRGSMPCFTLTGRSLYDIAGWQPEEVMSMNHLQKKQAIAIGIELKSTGKHGTSLPIVGEDKSGDGVQAHQLEALAALSRDGGWARLVWSNGGTVGVIENEAIEYVFHTYGVSVQAEKLRKEPARGSRSIKWELFRKIDLIDNPEQLILPAPLTPTAAQSLKAKNRRELKKEMEAADEPAIIVPWEAGEDLDD